MSGAAALPNAGCIIDVKVDSGRLMHCLLISEHLRRVFTFLIGHIVDGEQVFLNCGRGTATKVVRSKPD